MLKAAIIGWHRLIARSPVASRVYLEIVSRIARLSPQTVGMRVANHLVRGEITWPIENFSARCVTVGTRTSIMLVPHRDEHDWYALFVRKLDYERECFTWLEEQSLQRYDQVVEIGANVGLYSAFFDRLIRSDGRIRLKRIVSFEPSLKAYTRLLENLRANNTKSVLPFRAAVADAGGFREFFEPVGHLTNGSLIEGFARLFSEAVASTVVQTVGSPNLEFFFKERERTLIKIDVEGYEPDLIASLSDITLRYRPDLLIEVLPQTEDRIRTLPALRDYDAYLLTKNGPQMFPAVFASDIYRDWLLQPR